MRWLYDDELVRITQQAYKVTAAALGADTETNTYPAGTFAAALHANVMIIASQAREGANPNDGGRR